MAKTPKRQFSPIEYERVMAMRKARRTRKARSRARNARQNPKIWPAMVEGLGVISSQGQKRGG